MAMAEPRYAQKKAAGEKRDDICVNAVIDLKYLVVPVLHVITYVVIIMSETDALSDLYLLGVYSPHVMASRCTCQVSA